MKGPVKLSEEEGRNGEEDVVEGEGQFVLLFIDDVLDGLVLSPVFVGSLSVHISIITDRIS